ncbi:glycosyltransferase [Luteibacter sp. CQ10]|uniref:glycosyltransferase n=1 Tax=Luteibacter sp. CQ10 TaxID=2805821 RepID=UPI0034A513BD
MLATTYPRWQGDHEPGFVHELARRLTDRFDVVAVVPHARGALPREVLDGVTVVRYRYAPTSLETLVQDGGITTHLRRSPWKWLLVPGFFAMQWLTARRFATKGSVVHAHWIVLPGIVARLLGQPYLVTSHGADLFALKGRIAMRLKRWVLRNASEVTVVSRAMVAATAYLRNGKDPVVAPMGVDLTERFTPSSATPRDPDQLLYVGRLVEKKGVDMLLQAMPKILMRRPGARLAIVGHGPLEVALRQLAKNLSIEDSVDFVGPVPSSALPDFYRRASVFVAPFRAASSGDQEGLGLVLVEALGSGCRVVTTDVPATSDVTEGISGVFRVAAGNADEIATSVAALLDDSTEDRNCVSRSELFERFDWRRVAARYAGILESIRLKGA